MKLIVGLGNPGKRYERTRHNVGFWVAEELASRAGETFRRSWRVKAHLSRCRLAGENCLLAKPQTFMNRSGEAVAPLMRKHGIGVEDLIVVLDDTEIELGRLRVRARGSAGGHNGLKSLIQCLGSEAFARVRVGVGPADPKMDLADFVLSAFRSGELATVKEMMGRAADAVTYMLENGPEKAMNTFNG